MDTVDVPAVLPTAPALPESTGNGESTDHRTEQPEKSSEVPSEGVGTVDSDETRNEPVDGSEVTRPDPVVDAESDRE